jgi:hypothetical protein
VAGQSLVNIRRNLKGHQLSLKRKIDNAGPGANVTREENTLNVLNAFEEQLDVLFDASYGGDAAKLLQEFKNVGKEWGNKLAELLYNDFQYEFGRYGRSLSKGEVGEWGSNREYGSYGVGMKPTKWSPELIERVHNGRADDVAEYLNKTFGQKIIKKNGDIVFRIVDPTQQKIATKIIESALEIKMNRMGDDYFRGLQLKTERGLDELDKNIWQMIRYERELQHHLMIPEGASYN